MKTVLAGTVAALAVALVLVSASREQDVSGHSSAVPAASSRSPEPSPSALPGPPEDRRSPQPQGGTSLPRSETASDEPSKAEPVPTKDTPPAPQAVPTKDTPPPPDARLAALQELVAQSRQENERLGRIDEQLALARQQSADQELRREDEAELEAAQHAATVQSLEILRQAEAVLATGDSDGLDGELGRAEAALSGRTRIDVDAAREALERSDLYAARMYLAAALAERRALR